MYIVFFRRGRGSRELCQGAAWGWGGGEGLFLQAGGGMGREEPWAGGRQGGLGYYSVLGSF